MEGDPIITNPDLYRVVIESRLGPSAA